MGLSLKTTLAVESTLTTEVGSASSTLGYNLRPSQAWSDGTGANKAEDAWDVRATLGGSADAYDLTSLTDRNNGARSFAKVRVFAAHAPSTNAGDVTIEPAATNGWSPIGTIVLHPGETILKVVPTLAGMPVTGGASDAVEVSGASGDVYELYLAGE